MSKPPEGVWGYWGTFWPFGMCLLRLVVGILEQFKLSWGCVKVTGHLKGEIMLGPPGGMLETPEVVLMWYFWLTCRYFEVS